MSSNEQQSRALAESFRAEHGLGDLPVKDMFELVHATVGIDVISMPAGEAEHGLSMTDAATGKTVIAVATTPHPMRQRSSIAHELGHVLAGDLDRPDSLVPGERSPEEIRADAFARHLLLPLGALRARFTSRPAALTLAQLSDLVQEFDVSPQLAAIQLRTVQVIDEDTCAAWGALSARQLATRFGWLSQYRSLVADSELPRAPQNLMSRAVEGYHRGVLGVAELASWYGQDADELERQLGAATEIAGDSSGGGENADDSGEGVYDWADDWDSETPLFPGTSAGSAP